LDGRRFIRIRVDRARDQHVLEHALRRPSLEPGDGDEDARAVEAVVGRGEHLDDGSDAAQRRFAGHEIQRERELDAGGTVRARNEDRRLLDEPMEARDEVVGRLASGRDAQAQYAYLLTLGHPCVDHARAPQTKPSAKLVISQGATTSSSDEARAR
jgi:hypothetical protein